METIDVLRMFSDGRMSLHDARALMLSIGHTQEDFTAAMALLIAEPPSAVRVGAYQRDQMYSEIYLTV